MSGDGHTNGTADPPPGGGVTTPASFRVVPERAAVVLVARSNAGPITFGATGIEGSIEAEMDGGTVSVRVPPVARLRIPINSLTSGNQVYDAELMRRVDARLYPNAVLELRGASPVGATGRYHVNGDLTFHGVTRNLGGTVAVHVDGDGRMVVEGEHVLDMRGFEITPPTVAILRIYPDVRVQLHLEARIEPTRFEEI